MINHDSVINFYPYKIFETQNDRYIFSASNNGIFHADDISMSLLKYNGTSCAEVVRILTSTYSETEVLDTLKRMESFLLLKTSDNEDIIKTETEFEDDGFIKTIVLLIAQECNLNCSYCFAGDGEYSCRGVMKTSTAKRAVDFLMNNSKDNEVSITFFGGEPLLNFNLIKDVVEYVKQRKEPADKKVFFSITTNGTLINQEVSQYLIDNKIYVNVSIDGDREHNDKHRHFKNMAGSYDIVINSTQELRKLGLAGVRATVTPDNLDILHICNHLTELGFKNFAYAPAYNLFTNNDMNSNLINSRIAEIDRFFEYIENDQLEEAKLLHIVLKALKKVHNAVIRCYPCGAGRNLCAVDINGEIYTCHRLVGVEGFKIGSIFDDAISIGERFKFLSDIHLSGKSKCKECWAYNLCVGGCPSDCYNKTGVVTAPDENICIETLAFYEHLIAKYLHLTQEKKIKLFSRDKRDIV